MSPKIKEKTVLTISPVPNFLNRVNQTKLNNSQQNKYPNLMPLKQDTVSFSGARNLNRTLLESFDNKEQCEYVAANAKAAESNLKKTLSRALGQYVRTNSNPNGIIEPVVIRIKTPESIREKTASILEEAIVEHKQEKYINPNNPNDIKRVIGDIIGARIILRKNDAFNNSDIIRALINEVERGNLKIKGISVIMPEDAKAANPYFDYRDIERLQGAVNMQRVSAHLSPIQVSNVESASGYTAMHIDVDLSSDNMQVKNTGYSGEIQILGYSVAKFKELEDLCYKAKQGKDIKTGHPAYKPFVAYFNQHFNDSRYPNLKAHFEEYTKRAYLIQRAKDTNKKYKDSNNYKNFPYIAECTTVAGKIPPELDFNILARIKYHCDKLYEITTGENSTTHKYARQWPYKK